MTPLQQLHDLLLTLFASRAALDQFLAFHAPTLRSGIPDTTPNDAAFAAADLLTRHKAVTSEITRALIEHAPFQRSKIEAVARAFGVTPDGPLPPDSPGASGQPDGAVPSAKPPTRRWLLPGLTFAALAGVAVWLVQRPDAPTPPIVKPVHSANPLTPDLAKPPAQAVAPPAPLAAALDPTPTRNKPTAIKASRPVSIATLSAPASTPPPAPRASGDARCTLNRCNLTATTGTFAGMAHVCLTIPDRDAPVRCTVDGTPTQRTALCNFSSVAQQYDGTAKWTPC